jgi:hypothetical protein
MANCDPATLAAGAACFVCLDPHMQAAVQVRLLCGILNGESMSCDPQTLAADSACLACSFTNLQLSAIAISILCRITAGGGGGTGVGNVSSGPADPAGPPVTGAGLYYQTTDKSLWAWDSVLVGWVKLLGP